MPAHGAGLVALQMRVDARCAKDVLALAHDSVAADSLADRAAQVLIHSTLVNQTILVPTTWIHHDCGCRLGGFSGCGGVCGRRGGDAAGGNEASPASGQFPQPLFVAMVAWLPSSSLVLCI